MERVEHSKQGPGLLVVDNETRSCATRVTVAGRTITYRMNVIQQPQRARACGQGAKSSADRRPVDPPPIVELKVFEGEKEERDVTFTNNANYFLFAELQHARNIAPGRLPQERNMPPVFTGTPVAGIAYLDRPTPAGYFIFPDLSVRHEGQYRLSFRLYEEVKDPKDADEPEDGAQFDAAAAECYFSHRLEVKSEPFTVFSAKKFPGLTESTSLSRMVAEQGCRVRIRRDVRMRRREAKSGKDWDEYEDDTAPARASMTATPDMSMYPTLPLEPRPRSPSNASLQSNMSRRPSLQDISQPFPPAINSGFAQPSHYAPAAVAPPMQASMQPPPPQYQAQPYTPMPAAQSAEQAHFAPPAPVQQNTFSAVPRAYEPLPSAHRLNGEYYTHVKPEFSRRASVQYPTPPPPPTAYPTHSASAFSSQMSHLPQAPPPPQPVDHSYHRRAAPLEPVHPPTRASGANTPMSNQPSFNLPPLSTSLPHVPKLEASSPVSTSYSGAYGSSENNKRSYGNVFSNRHQSQPLRHGARPTAYADHTSPLESGADADAETTGDLDVSMLNMHYRRADGRQILRSLPPQG